MSKLAKLVKVNDAITLNRYDNGWMVEIGGKDKKDDWVTAKVMCATESELVDLIKDYNTKDVDR
jgi:hypothetical protein